MSKIADGFSRRRDVGRRGLVGADGDLHMEVITAARKPRVRRCTGVELDVGSALRPRLSLGDDLSPSSSSLSRAGNGTYVYRLAPGLWRVHGIIVAGRRQVSGVIEVLEGGRGCRYAPESAPEWALGHWPDQLRATRRRIASLNATAFRLFADISAEREHYPPCDIDGFHVFAEFRPMPSVEDIARDIARGEIGDTEAFARERSAPRAWRVEEPVRASATTAEAAAGKARELIDRRAREQHDAEEIARATGLPALTGSPRQVAWANTIRARAQRNDPSMKALKQATTARYWIDRRHQFRD